MDKPRLSEKFKEIKNINVSFCMKLKDIFYKVLFKTEPQNLNDEIQQNLKEYFLSKPGLYYLIGNSRKKEAEDFKTFIYTELLPKIENDIKDELLLIIKSKENKVHTLENKLDKIILQNKENNKLIKSLKSTNKEIKNQNKDLSLQNQTILQLAKKQNIKLDNIDHFIKKELIPNRNLPPINENLQHKLILYSNNNHYYFIRGQQKYIKDKLKKLINFEIILEKELPNPIDFVNKLKEISDNLNQNLKQNIKNYLNNKYGFIDKDKYKKKYYKNLYFIIDNNEIILNNTNIKQIRKYIRNLETIQKSIEE